MTASPKPTGWVSVARGIRYREHPSRKHGKKFDRYYTLVYKLNGKTISEAVGWSSEGIKQEDCTRILLTLKENHRSGCGPQTLKAMRESVVLAHEAQKQQEQVEASLTLQGIFEGGYLAAQVTKKASSIDAEKMHMRLHIIPFFGNTPLKQITASRMDEFLHWMTHKTSERTGKPLTPASIRYVLATVRQVWNYALSRGLVETAYPAQKMKIPNADNRRTRFLTNAEAEKLLDELYKRSTDTHDMALLSLYCGLRCGELFKITWADVNFSEGFIHIRDRKNGHSSTAWMVSRVEKMLQRRYQGQGPTAFVFASKDNDGGKAFLSKTFFRAVKDLGLNDGIVDHRDKIVFHSLRHTYASWLAQRGVPLHTLAGLMGHKTVAMTQRYAHLSPHGLRAAAMLIDEA
ncbi:MAG: tyrosine-type recombinase/integrase [Pseudomonadota bacterium]